ncbi:MAG: ATP-dependent helicase RecQ [Thermomicrobiales bacterium]|nr:ATP-dependent helicase RecQ [Thermomicrobiales bacterium]
MSETPKDKDEPAPSKIDQVAAKSFGFERLRPGQREAIEAVLSGRDTLVVMPTGSGKSAIFQIAGTLTPGATVVVSPLIALQQDQVESIEDLELGGAAQINSAVGARKREEVLAHLEQAELEFIFLAPEQLANEETFSRVRDACPTLFIVDEAHCISDWGHDFRPDYLRLGAAIEELGHPTTIALTATAAPPVRSEIVERLGMRSPAVIVQGFDRPNLHLTVERHVDQDEKRQAALDWVAAAEKPGIVYAATRRAVEEAAAELTARGVRAVPYHAGLPAVERDAAQTSFMSDEADVMVATIAFGMGIDKPNVRFVVHHDVSDSIDAYYQEIGRAGRDGLPAEAKLFYHPNDLNLRRFQASGGAPEEKVIEELLAAVRDNPTDPNIADLAPTLDLSPRTVSRLVTQLEDIGVLRLSAEGKITTASKGVGVDEVVSRLTEAHERRQTIERTRVEMMRQYAETQTCRREFILSYFGQIIEPPCGNCDSCEAGGVHTSLDVAATPYPIGSLVDHAAWGEGQVIRYEDHKIVVLFEDAGYRTLSLDVVTEEGLLRPVGGTS